MKSGALRDRVQYQEYVRADDGQGGFEERWQNACWLWAGIRPLTARESLFGGQVRAGATHAGRCRYNAQIKEKGRIVWKGRTLSVSQAIDVDERGRQGYELDLLLEEVREP